MTAFTRLAALLLVPWTLVAQSRSLRTLSGEATTFPESFSAISHMTELADGRVLVSDPVERRLGLANFRTGAFTPLGRQGQGPGEFRSIAAMHRVAGDSVLLWDPGNNRIHLIAPDGALVGEWAGGGSAGGLTRAVPRAVTVGGLWFLASGRIGAWDSTTIVRLNVATGRSDTLKSYPTPQLRPVRAPGGVIRTVAPGFLPVDAWGVFPDGRLLFVGGRDYLPEFLHPDGSRTRASVISHVPISVTTADRTRHLREVAAEMRRRLAGELAGGRGGAIPTVEALPPDRWQSHLPPIRSETIHVDSRGRAWVLVNDPDRLDGDRHDLLDATGRRVATVRLPAGIRLLGMGRGVLYTTSENSDGLVRLSRYPLP